MLHKQRNRKLPGQNKSSRHTACIQEFEINVRTKNSPDQSAYKPTDRGYLHSDLLSVFHFLFMYFQALSYFLTCSGISSLSANS